MCAQFLLVELQLLLECWQLVHHLLLGVFQLFDDLAAFLFGLLDAKFKVLSLRLHYLRQLILLLAHLLAILFQHSDGFDIFRLLARKFTQKCIIKLIISILIFIAKFINV